MSHDTTFDALHPGSRPSAAPAGAGLIAFVRRLVRPLRRGVDELGAIAREAAEVREMARRLQARDPGLAADLLAAADRHERQFAPAPSRRA